MSLRCVETGLEAPEQPAQVDSAADRTVIPLPLIEQLAAVPVRQVPVAGLGGGILLLPTYLLQITIRQLAPLTLEVLAATDEQHVLLGRDAPNQYRLHLDGPGLVLEID